MEDLFKNLFYASVGLASVATEKIDSTVKELVEKGKLSESEGKKIVEDFWKNTENKKEEFEEKLKKTVEDVVNRFNNASKTEITRLFDRIDALEDRLGLKDDKATTIADKAKEKVEEAMKNAEKVADDVVEKVTKTATKKDKVGV